MSPINTKTPLPSLAHCQAKGLRFPSFPSILELKRSSLLFYSSEETGDPSTAEVIQPDPNSYRFFKTVDQSLVHRISREFDILGRPDTEGTCHSLPLAIMCRYVAPQNPVHWLELSPRRYAVGHFHLSPPSTLLTDLDINRLVHPVQSLSSPEDSANLPDPRILILTVSPDASNSYIPIMNSIFSAQKLVSINHACSSLYPQLSSRKLR